jgi:hypothetical protein
MWVVKRRPIKISDALLIAIRELSSAFAEKECEGEEGMRRSSFDSGHLSIPLRPVPAQHFASAGCLWKFH